MESLVPDLSKITKTERIEEMVSYIDTIGYLAYWIHVWLSGIKALPDTNSYF
jgi:hypothetical protein